MEFERRVCVCVCVLKKSGRKEEKDLYKTVRHNFEIQILTHYTLYIDKRLSLNDNIKKAVCKWLY